MSLHDRAGNGQTHARALWVRGMECIENPFSTIRWQSHAGIADRNDELTFRIQSRRNRQFASAVFHGLDRVQHQVHEYLLQLHPVSEDVRPLFMQFGMDSYGVPKSFGPEQSGHLLNNLSYVDHLALRRRALFVEGPQAVDNVRRTANAKVADIVVRSCADCIFKSCPYERLVLWMESGPKAFESRRTLAWIEAVYAIRFVR